jgi:GT2 family glycosyltransferase
MTLERDIALVRTSSLLDGAWYLARHAEVAGLGIDAAEHYVRMGALMLRDPGPRFSTRLYLEAYPDVTATGANPLVHYIETGRVEGRAIFDVPLDPLLTDAEIRIRKEMDAIRDSGLFDANYYLDRNPDVHAKGMDPLRHFVRFGAREGRLPNPWFSIAAYRAACQAQDDPTNPLTHYITHPEHWGARTSDAFDGAFYLARYRDAADAGMPPLQHFLRTGLDEGRQATPGDPARMSPAHIVDVRRIRTTIIVPVFNAPLATAECLRSILCHTVLGTANRLLVIDDASTDAGVSDVLQRIAERRGAEVVRNPSNLGYTRTINHGCELAGSDDVVLLNSDTVVGPHWLRNLKIAAYRTPRTGTVTAVSNNAGAFSVPRPGRNDLPEGLDTDAMARIVASGRIGLPFEVPTGNGFSMYVKRALLDDIGVFDDANFPVGYGEENEFCVRAIEAGWCHKVDPRTYVGHVRSASFGDRREALAEAGVQRLREMHPEYVGAIRAIGMSRPFQIARYRIARELGRWAAGGRKPGPRIMFVISTRVGGTPQTNADLMRALAGSHECLALWCSRHVIEVLAVEGSGYRTLQRYTLSEPVRFATHVSSEYDDVVRSILVDWGVELLHIRHLAWHSLDLVDVAKSLEIPVVHSFHDFYAICPSVNLVDADGNFCPTGVAERARNPLWRGDPTDTGIDAAMLRHWQQRMQRTLAQCDAFVTTSQNAKDVLMHALPFLAERKADFHVIPHGRDFERFECLADTSALAPNEPLRILLPGNIGLAKGMQLIEQAKALDTTGKFEFHLLGTCDPALAGCVIDHGPYQRSDFAEKVAEIRPHIAAILSIWPETWCHTLTECWASGLPVLGIDIGAVGERIQRHGGGWLLGFPASGGSLHAELLRIREDAVGRRHRVEDIVLWQGGEGRRNSTARMAERYVRVYGDEMTSMRER